MRKASTGKRPGGRQAARQANKQCASMQEKSRKQAGGKQVERHRFFADCTHHNASTDFTLTAYLGLAVGVQVGWQEGEKMGSVEALRCPLAPLLPLTMDTIPMQTSFVGSKLTVSSSCTSTIAQLKSLNEQSDQQSRDWVGRANTAAQAPGHCVCDTATRRHCHNASDVVSAETLSTLDNAHAHAHGTRKQQPMRRLPCVLAATVRPNSCAPCTRPDLRLPKLGRLLLFQGLLEKSPRSPANSSSFSRVRNKQSYST